MVDRWAARTGIDAELAHDMTESIFVRPIDWVAEVERLHEAGARWIVDLGPSDTITRVTAPVIRGLGVGIVAAATRAGQRNLFTVVRHPRLRPPGRAMRRRSSRCPTVGQTLDQVHPPHRTLADPACWHDADHRRRQDRRRSGQRRPLAELAGGGQVTEPIFDGRIEELTQLLEPGRAIQFNTLFLDPYLWKLQVGGKRLVQKARQSGAPIDGVVVSAGIPELDEAVELIDELNGSGSPTWCSMPGTVEQIKSVIKIATEVPRGTSSCTSRAAGRRAPFLGRSRRPAGVDLR